MGNCTLDSYLGQMRNYIERARKLGVLEYVISDIIQKVMVFVGGFVIVRILTKEDYGIYTYVLNIFNIFYLLGDFGISTAVLQRASVHYVDETKRKAYICYGSKAIRMVSFISICIMVGAVLFYPFRTEEARRLFGFLFLLPIFNNEIQYFQHILRVELRNKEYAGINVVSTALHYISLIGFAIIMGLDGAIVSVYPKVMIVLVIYVITIKPRKNYQEHGKLTREEKKAFWKYALSIQVNQTIFTLLECIDIYCLGVMGVDVNMIAEYKVSSTIPTALYFVPKSVMFFLVPLMGRRKNDLGWMKSVFRKLVFANAVMCALVAIGFAVFAKSIICLLYGVQYMGSIMCYLILLVGFVAYAVLQSPASNILSVQEKVNVVLFASITGAFVNILLNIWLIHAIGSEGAAIATVISHTFVGCILTLYLIFSLRNVKIGVKQKDG